MLRLQQIDSEGWRDEPMAPSVCNWSTSPTGGQINQSQINAIDSAAKANGGTLSGAQMQQTALNNLTGPQTPATPSAPTPTPGVTQAKAPTAPSVQTFNPTPVPTTPNTASPSYTPFQFAPAASPQGPQGNPLLAAFGNQMPQNAGAVPSSQPQNAGAAPSPMGFGMPFNLSSLFSMFGGGGMSPNSPGTSAFSGG